MNKSELIGILSDKQAFLSKEDANESINLIVDFLAESLSEGNRVELRNFGTFSVRRRDKRLSRNPRTGKSISVEEKYYPYFRASKSLKEALMY